jgi:hypothetical protein
MRDHQFSKSQAQRVHARKQFRRRKNINFTDALHDEAVNRIRNGDPGVRLVERSSNRVSIWQVVVEGRDCRVVYDRKRRNIVTVLPERWNADYVQRWWEK